MPRNENTNRVGGKWTKEERLVVWKKGRLIPDFPPEIWRWDKCGTVMKFSEHGNRESESGWEIDHIDPVANGGQDEIANLQPLNWQNNVAKGDKLNWKCG